MKKGKSLLLVVFLFVIGLCPSLSFVRALDNTNENEEPTGEIVAEATKYYKTVTVLSNSNMMMTADLGEVSSFTTEVTEEEFENAPTDEEKAEAEAEASLSPQDTFSNYSTETTYKKLSSIISKPSNYYFKYTGILTWKNMPKVRSYDIIGLGYYASMKAGTPELTNSYCLTNGTCGTLMGYYAYSGQNGVAAMFNLPSGTLSSLSQKIEVEMEKSNPSSTIISQVCVADYSHAVKTITYSNAKNFKVDVGGITLLNGISSYYDTMPSVSSTWEGRW